METKAKFQHELFGQVEVVGGAEAEHNLKVLERHLRAEEVGDLASTMATMTANPSWINYGSGLTLHGYEAVSTRYGNRFKERPGLSVSITHTLATPSAVVLHMIWRDGGPPPGVPMLTWMDFENGLISTEIAYSNPPR